MGNDGVLLAFYTPSVYVIGCLVTGRFEKIDFHSWLQLVLVSRFEGFAVMSYFDSSEDDLRDDEYPDEADPNGDEDDESETVECPACGADVYEDSERCPACGEYISPDTSPLKGRSAAFVILGIAGIVATIWALVILF